MGADFAPTHKHLMVSNLSQSNITIALVLSVRIAASTRSIPAYPHTLSQSAKRASTT